MKNKLLSTTEVAAMLGISRVAVFKRIQSGTLPAKKVGRNYVIQGADLPIGNGGKLTSKRKSIIREAVKRTVHEYGETLHLLGTE